LFRYEDAASMSTNQKFMMMIEEGGGRRGGPAKVLMVGAVALLTMLTVVAVLWHTCGLRPCPRVDLLRGYLPDQASVLLDRDGKEVGRLFLARHVVVALDSLPGHVPNAFVAKEDKRFWRHRGVDWARVAGAAWRNAKSLDIEEGSSTITMQLARNVFPDALPARERTIWRKIAEARVAGEIEREFSKKEILQLYLNQIYFGNGAYGVEAAAQEYFGKRAAKLTLSEAALLAALPRAPSRLNPRNNPERAREGRGLVLDRMVSQGLISEREATRAAESKLRLKHGRLRTRDRAPYFVEAVRRRLEEELGDALYTQGLTIHTTLDVDLQAIAEEELRAQMHAIESGAYGRFRHTTYAVALRDTATEQEWTPYLQAAIVLMDAATGDVLALIGGRDFQDSQFNRATQGVRQPGSAFKPFVYAAAVAAGYPPTHQVLDEPLRLALDRKRWWEPKNYDGAYAGMLSMRDALTYSKNTATVRLAMEVGVDRVVEMARQMGLNGPLPYVPSVVLGAAEVTPLDLTSAYATFATLGQHPQPRLVTKVVDRDGNVVWSQAAQTQPSLDPAVAFVMNDLLKDVVNRGTGHAVRAAGFRGVAAGKTGTTNDAADIWFVGFTPNLVGTIWLGFDQRKTVVRGATGGELAAPLWGRIMRRSGLKSVDWAPPPGIEVRRVDEYGNVMSDFCPTGGLSRSEYFLVGTAPYGTCVAGPMYANGDTLGVIDDTLPAYDDDWWHRLRKRLFRSDTLATDRSRRPDSVAQDTTRRGDTLRLPDTLRPTNTTPPRLLGRPVAPPRRAPR
jgi:penicillin-binding protein 1A